MKKFLISLENKIVKENAHVHFRKSEETVTSLKYIEKVIV